ncbi:hypothetical protein [Streptomyces sp. NPDC020681]|uniref:hypothetical protein n=1 Tax=Streptomyces sp. NPDC020681 TaxID=3365083 RepID=UPI0037888FB0
MHGHGYGPPQPTRPSTAVLVTVRVLCVGLALLTFGLLAWGTMLRIAIMRRRRLDWVLFWISLALAIAAFVIIGEFAEDETTAVDFVFLPLLLGLAIGVPIHYLVADIRHYQKPRPAAWSPAPSPYTAPTVPYGMPPQAPQTPPGYGYPPVPPQPQPTAHPPQPRIDQVRAELDELSDYLRRDRGEQDR